VIDKAQSLGIINKTLRNFANTKNLAFISLRVEILSYQCISWVLESLRRDQMTPIESAIKNRIKEAFAFRVSQNLWENITHKIQNAANLSDAIKNWCNNLEKEDFQEKIHYIPTEKEHPETESFDSDQQV
jgi:hypothetical protein